MNYKIRALKKSEYGLLPEFLYEAIFIPPGVARPPREIIEEPELQLYIADFGAQVHDRALVAEAEGRIAGIVWVRIMEDYGHIDDQTPSLAIAVRQAYRSQGIGTALMEEMLALLKSCGYRQVSLSVQRANYAVCLYRRVGFEIVAEHAEEYIMAKQL